MHREPLLPAGVRVVPLRPHPDPRGTFTELFREEWDTGLRPVQWNVVTSAPGVLRGVHVHVRHDDYLCVVAGRASVGLRDLRRGSPTRDLVAVVPLGGEASRALVIPHGVAHGFLFAEPSVHVYGVSRVFDPEDELGCRWDDPGLGIPWPAAPALLSPRDAQAPPLAALLDRLEPFQPFLP